jgi:hypothetical protein
VELDHIEVAIWYHIYNSKALPPLSASSQRSFDYSKLHVSTLLHSPYCLMHLTPAAYTATTVTDNRISTTPWLMQLFRCHLHALYRVCDCSQLLGQCCQGLHCCCHLRLMWVAVRSTLDHITALVNAYTITSYQNVNGS